MEKHLGTRQPLLERGCMSNLSCFQFNTQEVRVILIEGEPWFVAKDLCSALEVSNVSQALTRLEPDEKRTIILNEGISGNPEKSIVSESGMFALVLSSRKREAKVFRKWVTSEVLPSIRKTGGYQQEPMSTGEMFVLQGQIMVEFEKRQKALEAKQKETELKQTELALKQKEVEGRIALIEKAKEEAEEELTAIPLSTEKPRSLTKRAKVNMLVRAKSNKDCLPYNVVWQQLYRELYYRYNYNVTTRSKNSGLKPLDQIEKDKMMDNLYALASEILV